MLTNKALEDYALHRLTKNKHLAAGPYPVSTMLFCCASCTRLVAYKCSIHESYSILRSFRPRAYQNLEYLLSYPLFFVSCVMLYSHPAHLTKPPYLWPVVAHLSPRKKIYDAAWTLDTTLPRRRTHH